MGFYGVKRAKVQICGRISREKKCELKMGRKIRRVEYVIVCVWMR